MTKEKVKEVLGIYRKKFQEMGIPEQKFAKDKFPVWGLDFLAHCHAMIPEMEKFLEEGRTDKVFRWLGFLQGCLWSWHIYTVEEMANHNRP